MSFSHPASSPPASSHPARLRIYGIARTRAFRALWMANELGLDYDYIPIEIGEHGARKSDYLAVNPNGRLPAIDDGGFVLWESLAITLYLAKKYGFGTFYPDTVEQEAECWKWTLWALNEVDRGVNIWSLHANRLPPGERNPAKLQEALDVIRGPFKVLDEAVCGRAHLAGEGFTVADLNVAAVISRAVEMDLSATPHLAAWLGRCLDRPAARKALALREAEEARTPPKVTRLIAARNRL